MIAEGEIATEEKYFVSVVQGESERNSASLCSSKQYRESAALSLDDSPGCAAVSSLMEQDSTMGIDSEDPAAAEVAPPSMASM